ncbi:SHOCT domain-containing protein [Candidatus Bipolaricaulota bacterium]|nr:SHOCT domain-containing protein [Candidatus Bipolaricaulota bacterium]
MMWHEAYLGGWWMVLPGAVVFFGLASLILLGVRPPTPERCRDEWRSVEKSARRPSMEVLEERYVRGEISKWEFDAMKRDLRG